MAIPNGKPATDFRRVRRFARRNRDDNGKVLTVVSGDWAAAAAPASGIPAPASPSDGDVLTYDSTTSAWVAEAPSGGLPSVSSSDNGKILGVVNGAWGAMDAPSGGLEGYHECTATVNNHNVVLSITYAQLADYLEDGIVPYFIAPSGVDLVTGNKYGVIWYAAESDNEMVTVSLSPLVDGGYSRTESYNPSATSSDYVTIIFE